MAAFHSKPERLRDTVEGRRDPKDRYETPDDAVDAVRPFLEPLLQGRPVVDPCCGTGRLLRRLGSYGWAVRGTDLEEDGVDFLSETQRVYPPGKEACVTNPPFSLAWPFVRRALELFDGPVCMLLPTDFLYSQGRRDWFAGEGRPTLQALIPWRVKFYTRDGKPIAGQAYSHSWVIWPERALRPSMAMVTDWCALTPERAARVRVGSGQYKGPRRTQTWAKLNEKRALDKAFEDAMG